MSKKKNRPPAYYIKRRPFQSSAPWDIVTIIHDHADAVQNFNSMKKEGGYNYMLSHSGMTIAYHP